MAIVAVFMYSNVYVFDAKPMCPIRSQYSVDHRVVARVLMFYWVVRRKEEYLLTSL